MKQIQWLILLVTLLSVPTAYGQFKIFPPQLKESDDPPTAKSREDTMTNADVIAMTSLGLSDEVIIEKITSGKTNNFDTSVEGLTILKGSKVSDPVIRLMINPSASQSINGAEASDNKAAQTAPTPVIHNTPHVERKSVSLLPGQEYKLTNHSYGKIEVHSTYPIRIVNGDCHNEYAVQFNCEGHPSPVFITDLRHMPRFETPRANPITITATEF
jgi:hypothetical protein